VSTTRVRWDAAAAAAVCEGALQAMGDAPSLEVGFEYRNITGMDLTERLGGWQAAEAQARSAPGSFSASLRGWKPGESYEVRAFVRHPLLTLYGREIQLRVPAR